MVDPSWFEFVRLFDVAEVDDDVAAGDVGAVVVDAAVVVAVDDARIVVAVVGIEYEQTIDDVVDLIVAAAVEYVKMIDDVAAVEYVD